LKVLIIGLGSIAQKHIESIKKIDPFVMLYALRSSSNSINIQDIVDIYKLEDIPSDIDFILITNPTSLHAETILSLIRLEKPLFIEKPVFDTLSNKDEIIKKVVEKNIKTYIGCNLRFHPALNFIKNLLNKNNIKINEVNIYCGSYLPDWRPSQDYRESYSSNKQLGGGVHLDLIHELDYAIWLFGKPLKSNSIKRKVSNLMIDTIDYSNYNLTYSDFNVSITLNYYRNKPKRQLEIILENEIILCDLLTSTITNINNDIIFKGDDFSFSKTYLNQMEYFINSLKIKNVYMNDIHESFEILKIALND
jgi:predicted dehydrogenase